MKLHETDQTGVLMFFCPGCKTPHPLHVAPQPIAWTWNGSMDEPTFDPSLLVYEHGIYPRCHSFIRNGRIEFLGDCGHALAGQTVDIPEWHA